MSDSTAREIETGALVAFHASRPDLARAERELCATSGTYLHAHRVRARFPYLLAALAITMLLGIALYSPAFSFLTVGPLLACTVSTLFAALRVWLVLTRVQDAWTGTHLHSDQPVD